MNQLLSLMFFFYYFLQYHLFLPYLLSSFLFFAIWWVLFILSFSLVIDQLAIKGHYFTTRGKQQIFVRKTCKQKTFATKNILYVSFFRACMWAGPTVLHSSTVQLRRHLAGQHHPVAHLSRVFHSPINRLPGPEPLVVPGPAAYDV